MKNVTFNKNFSHDLQFGQTNEQAIASILNLDTVEVKTERGDFSNPNSWVNTGNIAIEFFCRGKPSGISSTKATHWVHILEIDGEIQYSIILAVDTLRSIIKSLGKSIERFETQGGDDDAAKMYLFPTTMIGVNTSLILDAYELRHS